MCAPELTFGFPSQTTIPVIGCTLVKLVTPPPFKTDPSIIGVSLLAILLLPPQSISKQQTLKKINNRLLKRMEVGMMKEMQKLHRQGLSWKRMEELGLEYRYFALYLQKKLTKEKMLEKLSSEIYKYAKRQITWFKRDKEIKWFDASKNVAFEI